MARKFPLTRRRLFLVLLLLLIVVGGWWYLRQPKTYKLIRQFPIILCPAPGHFLPDGTAIREDIVYTGAGLIIRVDPTHFTLYDWNGQLRWTVQSKSSNTTAWLKHAMQHWSVQDDTWLRMTSAFMDASADGAFFVTAAIRPKQAEITTWKNGMKIGALHLPMREEYKEYYGNNYYESHPPIIMTVNNSGRILVAIKAERQFNLYLVDGSKLIAHGCCPSITAFSPDGSSLVTEDNIWQRYLSHFGSISRNYRLITVIGSRITTSPSIIVSESSAVGYGINPVDESSFLLPDGMVFEAGCILSRDKKTIGRVKYYSNNIFVPPGARHLLEYGPKGQLEACNISSMKCWGVTTMGAYGYGVLTLDGQHILSIPGDRLLYHFSPMVKRILTMRPEWNNKALDTAPRSINLYTAPGKLVARLPLKPASFSNGLPFTGNFWGEYNLDGIYPSPNGRTLVAIGKPRNGGDYRCLVFRY